MLLPAGEIPPNPSELLGSERMKVSLDVLRKDFDYILLDLPPVNAVSDPLIASKLTDGMILGGAAELQQQAFPWRKRCGSLRFVDAKILGFVMTSSDFRRQGQQEVL